MRQGWRQGGHTPLTYLPGLRCFFCSSSRLVNNSSVHRSRPWDGALQAKAIRCPSCWSLSSGSHSGGASSSSALSIPPSPNHGRVRRTVGSLIYNHWLISASVLPSALFSRICARWICDALLRPFVTMATSFCRSFSVRFTRCFSIVPFYFNPSALSCPSTRHIHRFDIPAPPSTENSLRNPDKKQLRADILAMFQQGMSYRKIGAALGIH